MGTHFKKGKANTPFFSTLGGSSKKSAQRTHGNFKVRLEARMQHRREIQTKKMLVWSMCRHLRQTMGLQTQKESTWSLLNVERVYLHMESWPGEFTEIY